jgi:hypothetical protein
VDLVGNNAFDVRVAADVIAGDLATATVHLGKSNMTIDRNTTKADLTATEANYTGYAAEAVTWLAPSLADDGNIEVVGTVGEFRPTDAVVDNAIYTLWVLSATTGTPLCFAALFDDGPLPMAGPLNSIVVTLRWRPETGGLVAVVS